MAVMCALTLWSVIGRFVFHAAPPWLEELSGFLFVWICFVSAAVTLQRRGHPRIEFLIERLPPVPASYVELGGRFAVLGFFLVIAGYGWQIALSEAGTAAPTSGVSMFWLYSSVCVGAVLASLYTLAEIANETRFDLGRTAFAAVALFVVVAILGRFVAVPVALVFVLLFALIVVMLLLGTPVAVALGFSTFIGIALTSKLPLLLVTQKMVDGLNTFILVAIPFFLLVGGLMASGATAARLLAFANAIVGWIRGGMGLADIVASAIFADISGSAVSDTAAIGAVVAPELVRRGFQKNYAAALQAAAGAQGILFPPSVTMIVYSWVADVSVAQLFLSLFVPGLLVMGSFMGLVYVTALREGHPSEGRPSLTKLREAFARGFLVLLTPAIILGGILSGAATPTEVGVIAVVYVFFLEVFIYRDLPLRRVGGVLLEAAMITGRVGIIIACASALGWFLVANQGPQKVIEALVPIAGNAFVLLILLNLFLVLIHTVLEAQTTTLVIVPLLIPVLAHFNVSLIHFGVLLNLNSAIGLILPPIGICLYIVSSQLNLSMTSVARAAIPFALVLAADLLLVVVFPQTATLLVR